MDKKNRDTSLKKRIRSGCVRREDVTRRLAELAFGSCYLLHRVDKRMLLNEEIYQWALCVEKGSEEPWDESGSTA